MNEAQRLISQETTTSSYANFIKKQSLDPESEFQRRGISEKVPMVQKSLSCIQEGLRLTSKVFYFDEEKITSDRQIASRLGKMRIGGPHNRFLSQQRTTEAKEANCAVFGALKASYDRTKRVLVSIDKLQSGTEDMKLKSSKSLAVSTSELLTTSSNSNRQTKRTPKRRSMFSPVKRSTNITPRLLNFLLSLSTKRSPATQNRFHNSRAFCVC